MKKMIVLIVLAMLFVGACSSLPIILLQELDEMVVTATPKFVIVNNTWEHTGQQIIDEFNPKSGWSCNPLREGIGTSCIHFGGEYGLYISWEKKGQFLSIGYTLDIDGSDESYDATIRFAYDLFNKFAPEYAMAWIDFEIDEADRCFELEWIECFSATKSYGQYYVLIQHDSDMENYEMLVMYTIHKGE